MQPLPSAEKKNIPTTVSKRRKTCNWYQARKTRVNILSKSGLGFAQSKGSVDVEYSSIHRLIVIFKLSMMSIYKQILFAVWSKGRLNI